MPITLVVGQIPLLDRAVPDGGHSSGCCGACADLVRRDLDCGASLTMTDAGVQIGLVT